MTEERTRSSYVVPRADPPAQDLIRLIESMGVIGSWEWNFLSKRQIWSQGFYKLLGLSRAQQPDYEIFRALIHPVDRGLIASACELPQSMIHPDRIVRIIRPDGTMRLLKCCNQIRHTDSGHPLSAAGIVIDFSESVASSKIYRKDEVDREKCSEGLFDVFLRHTNKEQEGRSLGTPNNVAALATSRIATEDYTELTSSVTPRHIRAARTLLDWSQAELARRSGFSISTIRRLEDENQCSDQCRFIILQTLRQANVDFLHAAHRAVAVVKYKCP